MHDYQTNHVVIRLNSRCCLRKTRVIDPAQDTWRHAFFRLECLAISIRASHPLFHAALLRHESGHSRVRDKGLVLYCLFGHGAAIMASSFFFFFSRQTRGYLHFYITRFQTISFREFSARNREFSETLNIYVPICMR